MGFSCAAGVAVVLVSMGPQFFGLSPEERLSQQVVASHVRSLMAQHLTDVENSNQHVVKPWFNGRLDFSPQVKDFSDHGFPLAGGRLDYLDGRAVAAIIYHRAAHPINLFTWPSPPGHERKEQLLTRRGYHLIHWSHEGMTTWVISDLNEKELQDFAELASR